MSICDARCPNAPEPPVVHECKLCGEEIREGDKFYRLEGRTYCVECVENAEEEAEWTEWY
jgi:recombinational DNA repair protein (RecF pathway)